MSDFAIKVETLSKAYILGLKEQQHESLMSAAMSFIKSPLENYRRIRQLGNLNHSSDSEDIFWALNDISFDVKQGEVIGIIGKNGAGKSTLLKILSQITEPTKGRITINGRVASLLEVGTGFNEELTGRENVYLNGTILGMTKKEIDARFDEIIAFSGVEKFLDTPVKRYSSGMRVRLAFAVAAHLDPEILIIDEVLAVGDAEFQKKCLGKMQDVAGQGKTVLFVSHNMTAIKNLCSKCIILKNGSIVFNGDVDAGVHKYLELNLREITDGIIPKDFQRTYSTGEAFFTQINILDEKGHMVENIFYRDNIRFRLRIDIVTEINDPYFSLVICSRDGDKIVMLDSHDINNASQQLKPGPVEFTFDLRTVLLPGDYTVTLNCSHLFGGKTIDYIEGIYAFEVLKTSRQKNMDYPWERSHGYIKGDFDFKIVNQS